MNGGGTESTSSRPIAAKKFPIVTARAQLRHLSFTDLGDNWGGPDLRYHSIVRSRDRGTQLNAAQMGELRYGSKGR